MDIDNKNFHVEQLKLYTSGKITSSQVISRLVNQCGALQDNRTKLEVENAQLKSSLDNVTSGKWTKQQIELGEAKGALLHAEVVIIPRLEADNKELVECLLEFACRPCVNYFDEDLICDKEECHVKDIINKHTTKPSENESRCPKLDCGHRNSSNCGTFQCPHEDKREDKPSKGE